MKPDKYHGEGGTFEIKGGERVLVTPPTQPHPDGDRARHADGTPVDAASAPAAQPVAVPAASDTTAARRAGARGSRFNAGDNTDSSSDN